MNNLTLNNGVSIPQLGLGVFQTPDGKQTEDAVRWALESGYRHIDTAKIYGNEDSVGKAIKDSNIKREDIFLTTKLWNEDIRQGRTKEAFEESLKALQTDYVDLYLIHWPATGYEQAWKEMIEIYKSGRARAIGVSNFHEHHLENLKNISDLMPAVNQIESNPYFSNQKLIDFCQKEGIAVEIWSPLGGTGSHLLQDSTLVELAHKYHKSAAQIVLRWDLQRNLIVFPKSTHQERIISNFDVFDFALSEEDMSKMNSLNKNLRVGPDPDNFDF